MKFIPFNLYDNQNLLPSNDDDEPIDVIASLNDFLMSTKGGEILHYNITSTNEFNILNRFHTQDVNIQSLSYIESNDSILTLEKDGEIGVVRVYQNWRQNQGYSSPQLDEGSSPLSSSPSTTNTTSSSILNSHSDSFENLNNSSNSNSNSMSQHHHALTLSTSLTTTKIPVPSSVVSISSCPITSRVIISTESYVSVWTPVYQNYPTLNYFEKILDIHIRDVLQVAIYENYLAYSTLNEVKVLSLSLSFKDPYLDIKKQQQKQQPNNQQPNNQPQQNTVDLSSSTSKTKNIIKTVNNGPSEIIEDEHYFEVTFDSNGNPTGKNQLPILEIKSILSSSTTTPTTASTNNNGIEEVLGPISDIEHGINVNSESGFSLLSSTLLLRLFKDDEIHTLFLLPDASSNNSILLDEPTTNNNSNTNNISNSTSKIPSTPPRNRSIGQMNIQSSKLSKSKSSNNINGGASTSVMGSKSMVYMRCIISTSRQGFVYNISKPSLLSCYLYANETIACTASQSFLYTITTEGLATWTLRSCEGANDGDVPPPCGLGLINFLYLRKVAVVGDHLLILSKTTNVQLSGGNGSNNNNNSNSNNNNSAPSSTSSSVLKVPNLLRSPSRTLSPNPKGSQSVSKQPEPKQMKPLPIMNVWSLYIIHHTPLQTLYNEILEYAIKTKEKDEDVYHQLLLEGHFLLQSKLANQHTFSIKMNDMASLINFGIERKIYQSLLKRSSTFLGEFFLKQQDYMRAALWYSSSDSDIESVFNLLVSTPESHKSLIYYLENVLYDPSSYELLSNNEELCNRILKHYHQHSPHRLPLLILESSISCYSQTLAIELLKEISVKGDFDLDESNRVYFALGLLYLDQMNISDTISSFNQIPTEALIQLCLKNPKLLAPPGESEPTALCKILRQSTPWGLLEITIQLVVQKEITPEFGLMILSSSTNTLSNGILNPISYHHNDYDFDSLLLKIYLEWFLSNNFKQQQLKQQQQQQQSNGSNSNNNGQSQQQQNGIFSSTSTFSQDLVPQFIKYLIHLYVQDIHRFRGSDQQLFDSLELDIQSIFNSINKQSQSQSQSPTNIPKSSQNQKIPNSNNNSSNSINNSFNSIQNNYCNQWIVFHLNSFLNIPQWLSKLPPFSTTDNPYAQNEVKYLLNSLYYRKLQSLLSINIIKDFEFMDTIETIFNENSGSSNGNGNQDQSNGNNNNSKEHIMLLSLKLACLPLLDRIKESIELVLQSNISIILDYSLHFCKQLGDWSIVLESILKKYQLEKSTTEKEIIIHEYEELLGHLSSFLDPESFLHLLPQNGKIDYYLLFIEKSFSNHQAKILKSNLSSNLLE